MHTKRPIQEGEIKAIKNAVIRYILNASAKKTAIKPIDIVKQCMRDDAKLFQQIFNEVKTDFEEIYGLDIHEIHEKSGRLYLVVPEQKASSSSAFTSSQREDMRLLLIILPYIFMKGGVVAEPALFKFLQKLGIEEEPDNSFGMFKTKINETFIKQMYLKKEKVEVENGTLEERFQYSWGHRAQLEYKKEDCLKYVAGLLKRSPRSFVAQYEECEFSDEENDENARPMEID